MRSATRPRRPAPPAAPTAGSPSRHPAARIDGVSGAPVTGDGHRESLQAALDAAHVG